MLQIAKGSAGYWFPDPLSSVAGGTASARASTRHPHRGIGSLGVMACGSASRRSRTRIELETLPPAYTTELYRQKCDLAYQYVFEPYPEANAWTGGSQAGH
jgi:hypothetical protein